MLNGIVGLALRGLWLTHVVTCLMAGSWGFLIAGAIIFPIAIVHGAMILLGLA